MSEAVELAIGALESRVDMQGIAGRVVLFSPAAPTPPSEGTYVERSAEFRRAVRRHVGDAWRGGLCGVLTLTILGCDGSHVSAGGAASGYLVREWETGTTIWLDAGPGTFANLQRFCDPRTVDAIVLSHLHGDHWTDVDGFLTAGRWTAKPPWGPVRVLHAPGIAEGFIQEPDGVLDSGGDLGVDQGDGRGDHR